MLALSFRINSSGFNWTLTQLALTDLSVRAILLCLCQRHWLRVIYLVRNTDFGRMRQKVLNDIFIFWFCHVFHVQKCHVIIQDSFLQVLFFNLYLFVLTRQLSTIIISFKEFCNPVCHLFPYKWLSRNSFLWTIVSWFSGDDSALVQMSFQFIFLYYLTRQYFCNHLPSFFPIIISGATDHFSYSIS